METLEQIKADAVEVFHFDRECRPQDRAHAYLGKYRVRRGYNDTAMQVAVTDMIERAYEAEAPDRKEGFWHLAKWAVAWLMGNLLYCEDECGECRDYEEFGL